MQNSLSWTYSGNTATLPLVKFVNNFTRMLKSLSTGPFNAFSNVSRKKDIYLAIVPTLFTFSQPQ